MSIEKIVSKLIEANQENRDKVIVTLQNNEVIGKLDGKQITPQSADEAWEWVKKALTDNANISNLEKETYEINGKKYNFSKAKNFWTNTKGNAWTFSIDSGAKDYNTKLEDYFGIIVKKAPKTTNESILEIYESEIKGKTVKKLEAIKEEIEDKYSKWF